MYLDTNVCIFALLVKKRNWVLLPPAAADCGCMWQQESGCIVCNWINDKQPNKQVWEKKGCKVSKASLYKKGQNIPGRRRITGLEIFRESKENWLIVDSKWAKCSNFSSTSRWLSKRKPNYQDHQLHITAHLLSMHINYLKVKPPRGFHVPRVTRIKHLWRLKCTLISINTC